MRRLALMALGLLLLASPARADLKLCNRTSYLLYAATSAVNGAASHTRGWTRLAPGDCAVAIGGPLTAQSYLVHARTARVHAGPARSWGGAFALCVKDRDFDVRQNGAVCTAADMFPLPFAAVETHRSRDWTMNFDELSALPSLQAAQLAGAKRLLTDNGYNVGPVNATPDRKTGLALSDFRRKMYFSPTAGNDQLFKALEAMAARRNVPDGYALCNDSAVPLMAAIARTESGKGVSRGWWKVAAHACAPLLATALHGPVYLLVQQMDGTVLVGGTQRFCVAPGSFEIADKGHCGAHGGSEAGFARTGDGRAGYAMHVGGRKSG